jgi:putative MATE family efflux protein
MKIDSAAMTRGPIMKNIWLYTLPIIATGILQLLFNAADLIVVGRAGGGSISVAAVGATGSITNLIVNLFIGLSLGVGVCVAQAAGANNPKKLHRIVHTAIPASFISGIVLTVFGAVFAEKFLMWMDTPDDVIGLSTTYMRIYFYGMTGSMVYNFGSAILRAVGDTKSPLYFLTAAGVLNVILNLIFVICFHMDVAGVAIATSVSQAVAAILVLITLIRRTDYIKFSFKDMRIYKTELMQIIRFGVPAGIQGSLFSISNVLIQSSVNSFGSVVMSGNASSQNIEGFVYTAMNSFSQTSLNFTGQNHGAGLHKRIDKILAACLLSVTLVGVVTGVGAYLAGDTLLRIYITDSAEAIMWGKVRLKYICLTYFLCGVMDVITGALRGIGSSIMPMIITVAGVCGLRIVWIFTVFGSAKYHTLDCLYLSYPISWIVTLAIELVAFVIINHKLKEKEQGAVSKEQ